MSAALQLLTPAVKALAKEADYDFKRRAPGVMLPYQQRWIADKAQVKVEEKSRRVGLSWAEAADSALEAAASSGQDVWYIGYNKDMAIEFILDVAQWAVHFNEVADAIECGEEVFKDGDEDIVGVEVGGAVKNVLAIATGLCDGLALGLNARAALITRGLAEMTRLGLALGARPDTFMGLSGLGDLVLTATGDLSRNRRVGMLLAQGQTLAQAVESLGHVAEGVYSARTVVQRAQTLGVDMPIAEAAVALLDGHLRPAEAVAQLMGRGPRGEL